MDWLRIQCDVDCLPWLARFTRSSDTLASHTQEANIGIRVDTPSCETYTTPSIQLIRHLLVYIGVSMDQCGRPCEDDQKRIFSGEALHDRIVVVGRPKLVTFVVALVQFRYCENGQECIAVRLYAILSAFGAKRIRIHVDLIAFWSYAKGINFSVEPYDAYLLIY